MRAFAFALIATASACVFQAVEECPRQGCPPDDSGLPESGDAGAADGGDGGLPVLDAGHGSDAGTDGGTPDAGLTFDGCLDELQGLVPRFPYADFIHVKGLAGPFGAIDYISGGGGAGGRGPNGSLWSLVPDEFNQQVPPAFHATTFWMYSGDEPVEVGKDYVGVNHGEQTGRGPMLNIALGRPNVSGGNCPPERGSGRFRFTRYDDRVGVDPLIEGLFEFRCPDAGMDLRGCFHIDI